MSNTALQLTGLLPNPQVTPKKDLLVPAGSEEPQLAEAQRTGIHPAPVVTE